MLLDIDWKITFNNAGQKTQLAMLAEVEITKDVDNMADTAAILLPETVMNDPLDFQEKIGRGTEVVIELGYNGNLETEFVGFVRDMVIVDGSMRIECEDALFLFRVGVNDKEMKPATLNEIARYVLEGTGFSLENTFDITYEKFTIHNATAYDVLKKLQEETKANITFDTENKVLHIHPPYSQKGGEVYYSMQKNIESSSLEYKNKLDHKLEVTVEGVDNAGKVRKYTTGTTGGDKLTMKVGSMDMESVKRIAEEALKTNLAAGYEGSFDTWLVPYVAPTYSARIKDEDYPEKTGTYFVKSVVTSLSSSGGRRTVTPGIRLN